MERELGRFAIYVRTLLSQLSVIRFEQAFVEERRSSFSSLAVALCCADREKRNDKINEVSGIKLFVNETSASVKAGRGRQR